MKCLEVRKREDGVTRRRYETPDGRRITTMEVPAPVLAEMGPRRLAEALARWRRGEASRARIVRIEQLLREGWKPTAIAHEVGCSDSRVCQIRAKLKEKT